MMPLLLLLSSLGLLLSAALHFSTYLGVDPQDHWPHLWLMYFGLLIPLFADYHLRKQHKTPTNPDPNLKYLAPHTPLWMKLAIKILIVYVFIVALVCCFKFRSSPIRLPDGAYAIQGHTKNFPITEHEYHFYRALEVRGMSALLMLFFASPLPALTSACHERRIPPPA